MTRKGTRLAHVARPFLAAFLSAVVVSCGVRSSPVAVADEDVLATLDCYEPMYQLDAQGHVIKLKITGLHLPVPVWADIGRLVELTFIDAAGSTLTDEGLAQLRNLQELRTFGLGSTLVTDQGLVHLEKLPNLQQVWLSKDTVTAEGVGKLKKARPDMNVHFQ
jgi:hypothetical protein